MAPILLPQAQHVVSYHLLLEGECYCENARLSHLIALTMAELSERQPGKECVLLRIGELMFVEVVRRYLSTLPASGQSWLAGLRDPLVGRALALMHARPAQAWTVEELARCIGASRSALAKRFTSLVGQPPMQYLTHWRMQLAAAKLADGQGKVSSVALEVGYDSEAAFSRAFKAFVGVPPATWRAQRAKTKTAAQ